MVARTDDPRCRPLITTDYSAVRAIGQAVHSENCDQTHTITPDGFAERVQSGCSFIAEINDRPVAYLLAQPIAYSDSNPLTIWVDEIAVHPDWRRTGIASALYGAFGSWAEGKGVQAALTRIYPDDHAARALHRRIGFDPHTADTVIWRFEGT